MKVYKTKDIILAATLTVKGYKIKTIQLEGSKGIFVFENVSDDDLTEFDLGNSLVEPVGFNNEIRRLTTSVKRLARDN